MGVACYYEIQHITALWGKMNVSLIKNSDRLEFILWNTTWITSLQLTSRYYNWYLNLFWVGVCFYVIQHSTAFNLKWKVLPIKMVIDMK
jgi:hypothetical protein